MQTVAGRDLILGLSISGGGIQAVELERSGAVTTLRAIDEWENTFSPTNETGPRNDGEGRQLGEQISRFIKKYRVAARRVSLALDTSFLFINTIPIDQGMTRNEISDQVKWELAQYYPDAASTDFITDLHVLTERSFGAYNEAMSVSLWRRDASSARKAVAAAGLELHIVDADHFAAETAYRVNYPDSYKKIVALVGIKETRIDITMMRNGALDTYQYGVVDSNAGIAERIAGLSRWNPDLQSVMIYGSYLDRDLLTAIRKASPVLVEALNPFRHLEIAESLLVDEHLNVPAFRFGAAVGVALRRD
jgi:Tfp pilus assembly PilM family ATPase